jgi:hypothetical protein
MLNDEERSDNESRAQFKERWTSTASATLNFPLRNEATRYLEIIKNAIDADEIVQNKYHMNRDCIALFSKQTVRFPCADTYRPFMHNIISFSRIIQLDCIA